MIVILKSSVTCGISAAFNPPGISVEEHLQSGGKQTSGLQAVAASLFDSIAYEQTQLNNANKVLNFSFIYNLRQNLNYVLVQYI